jgi:hypothetical protein
MHVPLPTSVRIPHKQPTSSVANRTLTGAWTPPQWPRSTDEDRHLVAGSAVDASAAAGGELEDLGLGGPGRVAGGGHRQRAVRGARLDCRLITSHGDFSDNGGVGQQAQQNPPQHPAAPSPVPGLRRWTTSQRRSTGLPMATRCRSGRWDPDTQRRSADALLLLARAKGRRRRHGCDHRPCMIEGRHTMEDPRVVRTHIRDRRSRDV